MKDNRLCTKCGLLPQVGTKPEPHCEPKCTCKAKRCRRDCCSDPFVFRKVVIPAALGDDLTGKDKPVNGAYTNAYVEYEANGSQYMYDSYGIYTKLEVKEQSGVTDFNELTSRPKYNGEIMTGDTDIPSVSAEALAREQADNGLQSQIDAITVSSDVKDVVGTYAELEAYDTSTLGDNDIIKVLEDEEHNDATTYYRWNATTQSFSLIGEEGPYYTKSAADSRFQAALTAGSHISIDPNNEISATYTHFTGTDGQADGVAGLVPAPTTTDAGKFLKADGTWEAVGGGSSVNVVQAVGTSTTDVMSQKAVTDMVYADADGSTSRGIQIPFLNNGSAYRPGVANSSILIGSRLNNSALGSHSVVIGGNAGPGNSTASYVTSIGYSSRVNQTYGTAVGNSAIVGHSQSVALGNSTNTSRQLEVSVGSGTAGASGETTRFIAHVSDPANVTDAANKRYVDSLYPVGTVYTSTSSVAPTFAGGTWTGIGSQTIGSATIYYYERTA